MKVLHVIPSVGPLRGGPSLGLRALTRSLVRLGIDVDVATTDDNGPERLDVRHGEPVVEDGVTFHYFPRQTRFYTGSWSLTRWLRRHVPRFDAVHVHALFSHAPVVAALTASRRRVPYVVRPLGTLNRWGMEHRRRWWKGASFRLLERRILAGAAFVQYTSEAERSEAERLGVHHSSIVIPMGVDVDAFDRRRSAAWLQGRGRRFEGKLVILFVSRIDPKKGLDLLLRAFAEVRKRRPDVTLVVGGSGEAEFEAAMRTEAHQLGLDSDVLWTGFLDEADKRGAFAAADVFVLASYSENFGLSVVEAMACGLPVIVSDQVGIADTITAADAGLVVPCEVDPLVSSLCTLIDDPVRRKRLGDRGVELARDRFSIQAAAARLAELYSRMVSSTVPVVA